MSAVPTLILAPTPAEARRAAWDVVARDSSNSVLDPPVVFCSSNTMGPWRQMVREESAHAQGLPRLVRAEDYFARAHASLARQRFIVGADRAWVVSGLLPHFEAHPALGRLIKSRDFAQTFGNLVARLRRAGLSQFPSGELGDELNALLGRYEGRCKQLRAFDYEASPSLFAASSQENRAFIWPRTLVVDDLLDPSPALQVGLKALFERANVVVATLVCPGGLDSDPAFQGALTFWLAQGAKIVWAGGVGSAGSRAAARLLGEEVQVEKPNNIRLTTAHTPWEEMNRVAAYIRSEVERGAQPDEFAVAFADFNGYEPVARHAFASLGVPLDWPRPTPLKNSPLVRALLSAAQGCRDKWNVHELHDLFGDGTLQLNLENKVFDPRRLRAAAKTARTFDLSDIDGTRAAFETRLKRTLTETKRDEARERAALQASLDAGDLELVAHFRELCLAPQLRLSATDWQTRLFRLIDALAGHWLEAQTEAALAAQKAIVSLRAAAERVVERARGWSDEEVEPEERPVAEWLRWLNLEIDATGEQTGEVGGVRVGFITAPPEASRTLFLCGLTEDAWPGAAASSALGENGREVEGALNAYETSPAVRATHVLARCLTRGTLSLSHARFVAGKEKSASTILDDLKAAWPNESSWDSLPLLEAAATSSRRAQLMELERWQAGSGSEGLREVEPHLRTLTVMRSQRQDVQLGVYDGVLGEFGPQLMARWRQLQKGDSLSVSALERYAACPLRYFFERVLSIEVDEKADDDLDPRSAGNLVHAIVHRFLQTWHTPLTQDDFEKALNALAEVCWSECQKLHLRPILREAEYHRLMGADVRSGPLVKWLKLEISLGNGAWPVEMRPLRHTTTTIDGVSDGLEHRFKVPIANQEVSGIIDRLAVSPDGSQLAVIDYKTGSISNLPSWKNGDDGLHFQLPVYALAAREITRGRAEPPRLSMAYLMMREAKIARGIGQEGTLGKGCSGAKNLPDDLFEAWLQDVEKRVARIAQLRNSGTFNITLQSATTAKCDSCSVRSLCGQRAQTQTLRLEQLQGSNEFYAPLQRKWEE